MDRYNMEVDYGDCWYEGDIPSVKAVQAVQDEKGDWVKVEDILKVVTMILSDALDESTEETIKRLKNRWMVSDV